MSITKIAKMTTEITADYQKLSDLNVAFYNQDVNTSILQFNVTRNNAPVPLGKVNIEGYIVLLAADGSRIQDAVKVVDELKGVIEYTIPKEFLKHTGTAVGQIYIAVKGKDDTAVMRQFSFDINKDLLTEFSATKKLEYIKTFDDLTTFIKQRVQAIDKAIANGADYVTAMEKAAEKGRKDIQAVATKATADVNKAATDATKKITDTSNTAVATVNAKGDEVVKKITDADVVQKKDYYPLIGGGGTRTRLTDGTDLLTLATGYYEVAQCKNSPFSETEASWKNIDVVDGNAGRKMLRLTVSAKGDTYYKTLHTHSTGGRDWWQFADATAIGVELASVIGSNTGWLPLPLLNGVATSTPCFYRFYSTNGIYYLSFKGALNTLSRRDVIVAKLPAEVTAKIDRALTWVGNTSVSSNKASFNRWLVEVDGTIKFTASSFGDAGESGPWNWFDVTLTL